jgi:hypothetical protein
MRTWLSFPLVNGIRAGVSVNPNSFITRELPWFQCLSKTGKKVWFVGAAAIAVLFLTWLIGTKDHWNEEYGSQC